MNPSGGPSTFADEKGIKVGKGSEGEVECAFGDSPKEMVLVAPQVRWKDGRISFMHPELRITKQIEQVDEFSYHNPPNFT